MADPVADFLEREQNMFADFDGVPPVNGAAQAVDEGAAIDDDFGDLQDANVAPAAAIPIVPVVHAADSGVDLEGLIDDAVQAPPAIVPLINGNGTHSSGNSHGPSPVLSSVPRIEAEKIRLWKEQQKRVLEEKDALEEKKKEELKASAKKELEDWYKQREKTLSLAHAENLKNENANQELFAKQQDGEAQWETVNKLVDAQKSKSGKDLSRLKTLLAGLKHLDVSK